MKDKIAFLFDEHKKNMLIPYNHLTDVQHAIDKEFMSFVTKIDISPDNKIHFTTYSGRIFST